MGAIEININELEFPVVLRPSAPMTDEEFLCFSARNSPWRIESNGEGEIVIMTPVTGKGGTNEAYVARVFSNWVEHDGRGVEFSPNTGFKLKDGSTRSPDAAWLPLDRWNALTPEQQDSFLPFCPEFLIEVRSKSDRRKVLEAKMQTWVESGTKLAWLVDPIEASVTIYEPGKEPVTLDRPEIVTATDPVAGFALPCKRLWPD